LSSATFTERVQQELARLPAERPCDRRAELAAIIGLTGELHLRHGAQDPLQLDVPTRSGAVARRTFALLQRELDVHATIEVHEPTALHARPTYRVCIEDGARRAATELGVLDTDGRPSGAPPTTLTDADCDAIAYLRGALVAAGSVSRPGRPAHLEIVAPSRDQAEHIAGLIARSTGRHASVAASGERWRAVVKSGEAIGDLLQEVGATAAYLEWEEQRLRRALRGEATRLSNADAANVRRAVDAAATRVRAVERAVAAVGWAGLGDDLREVALARLTNPEATLEELGRLLDPPVGKSTVHRRLERLTTLSRLG
jgi:cell division protein WhiA